MDASEFVKGAKWLGHEFLKFFYSPTGVAGGLLDAFRGWKFSRSWVRFWFHLPSLALLSIVYLVFAFSIFSREDSRLQLLSVESERRCPTRQIEDVCNQLFEADFAAVLGIRSSEMADFKVVPITDLTKHYVELLSKRILSLQPRNLVANYRLAMIYNIHGQAEEGISIMRELANGNFGDCPQANAWMVKELLREMQAGARISSQELLDNLEKAAKWKESDFRLTSLHARVLDESGERIKAIAILKQAAATRPEFNLELARLYSKVGGYENEMLSAASASEDVFTKRLNTSLEKESDRLAVAEARKLTNKLEQAASILSEGLLRNGTPAIRRELSEVQRLICVKSIFKTEAGPFKADLVQLEKAVDADPSNPNLSSEIAKLLQLKIKPTKKLVDTLKQQMESGITTVAAHIFLAEGYIASGNTKEAASNWEIALAKDPNNVGAMNNLALVLARNSEANVERSLVLLEKALSLAPGNAEILDSLGDVLMIAKRSKEAINKFELAVRNDASRINTRKKLVHAYQLNDMEDMAKTLSKVIQQMEKDLADDQAKSKENDLF